ncbi:hypothetical protein L0337_28740 [candidate division KSB1 bacterium]|nr:hypothetical protein [candidate division KSB1 bacterium]
MKTLKSTVVAILIVGLFGCAGTLPPVKPLSSEMSAIGIAVKTRAPLKLFGDKANMVYFIKLDEVDSVARANYMVQSNQLIQSNYANKNQIYLLNARPGRYAVVAAFHSESTPDIPSGSGPGKSGVSVSVGLNMPSETKNTTFFAKEIIKLTEVTVTPGAMVFMGDYVISQSTGFKEADETQLHYLQLIAPGAKTGYLSMAFSGSNYYKGSLHEHKRDRQTEMQFFANALEHLKGSEWINIIHKEMDQLRAEK